VTAKRSSANAEEPAPEADRLAAFPHPRHQSMFFGHQEAGAILAQAARAGRLHHGLLLTGSRGVGKATLAWRLARALLTAGPDGPNDALTAGSSHPGNALINQLSHPDLLLIRRPWDEKTKKFKTEIPADDIRRVGQFFGRHAAMGGWRIAIVDAADDMSTAAENALLKTLEEPPPRALLILIAHAPGALLPTTRSRCRKVALKPLTAADMALAMDSLGQGTAPDARALVTALAEGSPGRALALGESGAAALFQDIQHMIASLPRVDLGLATALADRLARPQAGADFQLFTELMGQTLRWIVLARAGHPERLAQLGPQAAVLERVAAGANLEQWAALWENLATAARRSDALNLDKRHLVVSAFMEAQEALRAT
jgi:DNA polymerase III subunit delta'